MSDRIVVVPDYETMSQLAAEAILLAIRRSPTLLMCAATGATPTRAYDLLTQHARPLTATSPQMTGAMEDASQTLCENGDLFSQLRIIKLDEWYGLKADDPASCEAYLQQHLVHPLKISSDRYFGFKSDLQNPEAECVRIASVLEQHGPIDLAIVGIGKNGHVGFNEPQNALVAHAHVAELAFETRQHAMLNISPVDNPQETIRYGMTLGMTDLLQARQVIILASGPSKQPPLKRMFDLTSVESWTPASYLWQHHSNAVCICDLAAIGKATTK